MSNLAYDFIMKSWMSHPDCSLYALVDGLQYERHFGEEIHAEDGIVVPFFNMWPDSRIAFAGPWLYRLNRSSCHRKKLKQLEEALPSVSWLISSASLENLVAHFQPFPNLQLPDSRCALFRFYDPRILKEIELLMDETDYGKLVEVAREWVFSSKKDMRHVKGNVNFYADK